MTFKMKDLDLDKALAVLVASTKSKRRRFALTEISEWLKVAVSKLGSYHAVADRVGITPKMLRQFSAVERTTSSVKKLFRDRSLDSVDAATHLAMLAASDQLPVASALANRTIDTSDVRATLESRKRNPTRPIEDILKDVRHSKTQMHYVIEFVIRGDMSAAAIQRKLEKRIPPAGIVRVEAEGPFGRLILTRDGKAQLTAKSKQLGVRLRDAVPTILSET